jgi:Txe/YoeB family toxin of Txe-Axe toxin-antitoxin module
MYILQFSEKTDEDFRTHKRSGNKIIIKKIITLLEEIAHHLFESASKKNGFQEHLHLPGSNEV